MLQVKGTGVVELIRDGRVVARHDFTNGVTDDGLVKMLDVMFHADTQSNPWYLGLISGAGTPALADSDTMAAHAGWVELTSYDEATRVDWGEDAAASNSITNTTQVTFTISGTCVLWGMFLTDDSVKGATDGTLWATAQFPSAQSCSDGDVIKITYTVTLVAV